MIDLSVLYRTLPSVDHVLKAEGISHLLKEHGMVATTVAVREVLKQAREVISRDQCAPKWLDLPAKLVEVVSCQLQKQRQMALRQVFNLTGTVLHTNLGRSLLCEQAIRAVTEAMRYPINLEWDVATGERGHRDQAVASLLCELTGAEAACVVNNNAAAVLIMLSTMASGREVILSRGEMVEIGGAFRMPDVMRQAGCSLVEVGTTNRTHLKDYQQAITANTALLMKVHPSNYAVIGFNQSVEEQALATLAQHHGLPVVTDLGSGALVDLSDYGLPFEPTPQRLLQAGLDIVTFSGDKLLGGPQAGLIVGKRQWIDAMQKHPLKRALRCDKMTLAALEATLRLYREPDRLAEHLPALRLLTRDPAAMLASAKRLQPVLAACLGECFRVDIQACDSQIGSGSLPVDRLPSWALVIEALGQARIQDIVQALRVLSHPIIGRLKEGKLWLDLRCLEDESVFIQTVADLAV